MKKFKNIDSNDFNFFDASVIYKSIYNPQKQICLYLNDYSDKEHFLLALDEELMQDGENLYTFDCYQEVPECFLGEEPEFVSEKFWEFLQALVEATNEDGFIVFLNAYSQFEYVDNIDFEFAVNDFNDKYYGYWHSKTDFAENIANDCYNIDNLGSIAKYFDYEAFATDLFLTEYDFVDGYVFRQN